MNLPFSPAEFMQVFKSYNESLWPAQIFLLLLAAIIVFLVFTKLRLKNRLIAAGIALLWIWMGVFYHWMFFVTINPAAKIFAPLFILQGLLVLVAGVLAKVVSFTGRGRAPARAG